MTDALNIAEVVDTLVDLDLVDFYGSGPWPGEPEASDVYEPDWGQVLPTSPDIETTQMDMPRDSWSSTCEEIWNRADAGFLTPPDDVIDALAWYTPMHYYGLGSAIYIREAAVFDVAATILNRLEPYDRKIRQMSLLRRERRCPCSICTRLFTTRSNPWRSDTKSSSGHGGMCPIRMRW